MLTRDKQLQPSQQQPEQEPWERQIQAFGICQPARTSLSTRVLGSGKSHGFRSK